ncbi:MAG TPA: DUF2267 domain-containing protein [Polyangiaceae bacterium]|jgi:uncharacterized protein (DUF2267 family)
MEHDIVERALELGPFLNREQAERAVHAVLEVLGERLTDDEARSLAAELPEGLRSPLRGARYVGDFGVQNFLERVGTHELVKRSFAVEHVEIVCRALCEALPDETLQRLIRHLPEYAELFTVPDVPPPPERAYELRHAERPEHTLSSGRPGASRPISESRPGSTHPLSEAKPERGHSQSVARSDDPHRDSRLSSSRGLTQEREEHTLSTGRPAGKT